MGITRSVKELYEELLGNPWLIYPFRIVAKPLVFCHYGMFKYYSLNTVIFKTF